MEKVKFDHLELTETQKNIPTHLISSAARIMVVAHQGDAKSEEFLGSEQSAGHGSRDTPEMGCSGEDAKTNWPICNCPNNSALSVCEVADQWLDFNVERCFLVVSSEFGSYL